MKNKIWLIIEREFYSRVKKKTFILMTILLPVFTALVMIAAVWFSMTDNQNQKILIVDDNYPVFSDIKSEKGIAYEYLNIPLGKAQMLMLESDYTAVLYLPSNIVQANTAKLYVKKMPGAITQRRIEKQIEKVIEVQKLKLNNIDPNIYSKINTNFNLSPFKLDQQGEEKKVNTDQAYVGLTLGVFIFFFISFYGVQAMRAVMEEKSNRIVEVIICSVRPFQLMMGKVIGIALVAFTQVLIWTALTGIVFAGLKSTFFNDFYDPSVIQNTQMTQDVMDEVKNEEISAINLYDPNNIINRINFPLIIGIFIFYFIGGYLLYASLYAAIGAIVDNETDTQQFMLPVTLPLLLAYIASTGIVNNPEGDAALWLSMIPFTSPIVMMIRISIGVGGGEGLPYWQLFLSMGMLILGFIFTTWISGKLYRTGILMYGKKPTWKELWKWLRYKD